MRCFRIFAEKANRLNQLNIFVICVGRRSCLLYTEWYNHEVAKTPLVLFDELCDEVQRKLNEATNSVENVLFDYCVRLKK